jgi:hypothetical protein
MIKAGDSIHFLSLPRTRGRIILILIRGTSLFELSQEVDRMIFIMVNYPSK